MNTELFFAIISIMAFVELRYFFIKITIMKDVKLIVNKMNAEYCLTATEKQYLQKVSTRSVSIAHLLLIIIAFPVIITRYFINPAKIWDSVQMPAEYKSLEKKCPKLFDRYRKKTFHMQISASGLLNILFLIEIFLMLIIAIIIFGFRDNLTTKANRAYQFGIGKTLAF